MSYFHSTGGHKSQPVAVPINLQNHLASERTSKIKMVNISYLTNKVMNYPVMSLFHYSMETCQAAISFTNNLLFWHLIFLTACLRE